MTIHGSHPFEPSDGDKDPMRRIRGRLAAPVTIWTTYADARPLGWTVSSLLVAPGPTDAVIALIDPDCDVWTAKPDKVAVSVLGRGHEYLADAMAGLAPAPGGPFTLGQWVPGEAGPVLRDAVASFTLTIDHEASAERGWNVVVYATIDEARVSEGDPLIHVRGEYRL